MIALKQLFRSIVALVFSVICIGGGTAIMIVAVARASGHLGVPAAGGLALVLFGGYVLLLASPYKGNIKLSGTFSGMSFAFSRRDDGTLEQRQSVLVRLFSALAMFVVSLLCLGGGIALIIVSLVRHEGAQTPYAMVFSGVVQCLFGGYLAMLATGASPWVKASGSLDEGLAVELREE